MTRILVISDIESPALWNATSFRQMHPIDLILSCGDLHASYLEYLVTMFSRPLYYVHGNHDLGKEPEGCICLDDDIIQTHGLRIAGLGGAFGLYEQAWLFDEKEMEKRIKKLRRKIRKQKGIDIFVSHAPCMGYGDLADMMHQGFACFNDFLDQYHPTYMFYGHCHLEYGSFERVRHHPSGTTLINGYGYTIVEI